jgi:hypothetical protein
MYLSLAVHWQTPFLLSVLCKKPPSFWWGLFLLDSATGTNLLHYPSGEVSGAYGGTETELRAQVQLASRVSSR